MNGHTATSNGHRRVVAPHALPAPATASAEGGAQRVAAFSASARHQLNGAPFSRLPTFVRLALLVRPWWRGVVLNLTAALLNQGAGIALAVVSALLVAHVASGT